jgi:hypothetical protein
VSQKKHGRSSPVGFPPRPPVVAGGAHSGNFLAFVGGWFKFKLGYLNTFHNHKLKIKIFALCQDSLLI